MPSELCPKCGAPRNMAASVSGRDEVDSEGKTKRVVTTSYQCEICGSFVRSEDHEETTGSADAGTAR
jgi:rubredoxin